MTRSDALDVLGLSPPVKNSTIEEAYRNRVKEVHPDRGGNVDEFKQVQQAYEVLSETEA